MLRPVALIVALALSFALTTSAAPVLAQGKPPAAKPGTPAAATHYVLLSAGEGGVAESTHVMMPMVPTDEWGIPKSPLPTVSTFGERIASPWTPAGEHTKRPALIYGPTGSITPLSR